MGVKHARTASSEGGSAVVAGSVIGFVTSGCFPARRRKGFRAWSRRRMKELRLRSGLLVLTLFRSTIPALFRSAQAANSQIQPLVFAA